MKVEDNHYKYRIETKDSNGSIIDFVDIDTVEPLRCAYDVQDELNLETNEHIKRVEEIILNADSTEFWYVDEDRSTDTHLVCYFEEVQLMANADHPMVDTDRSLFEYGKINANEYQDTNFICTHVMPNGVSRIYMSIDKDQLLYQTYTNETIKEYIAQNPITIWYAIRYPVAIPRSMSKGHLLTLDGQTDVSISTNGDCGLPLVKFNIGDKEYNMDNNPIHLSSTTEGTQIRNIVLEGNTPINFARGNGVNTTEATSHTRYDFAPFYDGQTTIQGTVEGGYVSAKLYGDTMVNIAKPYGETPLLTVTNASTLCDDLLGANEEGVVLADGEIAEGRIYGDSLVNLIGTKRDGYDANNNYVYTVGQVVQGVFIFPLNRKIVSGMTYTVYMNIPQKDTGCVVGLLDGNTNNLLIQGEKGANEGLSRVTFVATKDSAATPYLRVIFNINSSATKDSHLSAKIFVFEGDVEFDYNKHGEFFGIGSVVNPTVISNGILKYGNLDAVNGGEIKPSTTQMYSDFLPVPTANFTFSTKNGWARLVWYNENKEYIKYAQTGNPNITPLKITNIPTNAKYVRFGFSGTNLKDTTIKYTDGTDVYPNLQLQQAILPYTLNKLPNGVADYIDVVNKVHVQRVGVFVAEGSDDEIWGVHTPSTIEEVSCVFSVPLDFKCNGNHNSSSKGATICDKWEFGETNQIDVSNAKEECVQIYNSTLRLKLHKDRLPSVNVNGLKTYLQTNQFTVLYELKTPIYTPLTEEQIAQLPLSAYADGYVMLSSDQLTPSFEFRMRTSNRYQVDMLETGYYYLNAPTGNVKLGTASVDVQQMPCIVKVDNVGTGDSGYRLGFDGGESIHVLNPSGIYGYWVDDKTGELKNSSVPEKQFLSDFIEIDTNISSIVLVDDGSNKDISFWDENKAFVKRSAIHNNRGVFKATIPNQPFKFIRIGSFDSSDLKARAIINPITLAKLPSHRIPTTFTQGMKCVTDFRYWEGIKEAQISMYRTYKNAETKDRVDLSKYIELNRIEYGNTIVEDEFDIATGRLTKRVGVKLVTVEDVKKISSYGTDGDTYYCYGFDSMFPNWKSRGIFRANGVNYHNSHRTKPSRSTLEFYMSYIVGFNFDLIYSYADKKRVIINELNNTGGFTVYYELEVPEISYVSLPLYTLKTLDATTTLQVANQSTTNYLLPQVKPSHLTYPVPSLVGNREYTVVHNRKNISGSTKPITLDLGGTQVELNDASSKTLVKTPSTLAHSNLIFIGGESTVDHIMVLDGDWTNKPIEYFENMKGHDTDAIITIMGDGKIDDVAEQYLW